MTDILTRSTQPELAPLDAYSQVVVSVAERLTPRVAALQVARRRRDGRVEAGTGSAVVFTNDGFLLTNAHVVGKAEAGQVAFADGTVVPFRVVGTDPLPTWRWSELTTQPGDVLVVANGEAVTTAQSLQRLMLGDAIGQPLTLTVLRAEALVDVIAIPEELRSAS
jgi:S1-C subfamily serine protease